MNSAESSKRYTITIGGHRYTLMSDEPEEHVLKAVALVEKVIQETVSKQTSLDVKNLLLIALIIARKYIQADSLIQSIAQREQVLVSSIDQVLKAP